MVVVVDSVTVLADALNDKAMTKAAVKNKFFIMLYFIGYTCSLYNQYERTIPKHSVLLIHVA